MIVVINCFYSHTIKKKGGWKGLILRKNEFDSFFVGLKAISH